jgi:hypothetical protein
MYTHPAQQQQINKIEHAPNRKNKRERKVEFKEL